MEKCFDNDLYLKIQVEEISKRIKQFGNKLYLEIGGKLFDDYHASRVLPGFEPDNKIKALLNFKDESEVIIVVNANDIDSNKIRNDFGISYEQEVERLINVYSDINMNVSGVVISFYHNSKTIIKFINKLNKFGIKTYKHYQIEGYPNNLDVALSKNGFGKNEYIKTSKPLVIVTAPGPGSGKMACCLSQIYLDHIYGIDSGYAKFETFPIWNISINSPINMAYEAATADIGDFNVIDTYHKNKYKVIATSYNRDMDAYPLLSDIFIRIYGTTPYNSPTDMGVNTLGIAIKNMNIANESSKQEIIRRYFQAKKNCYIGTFSENAVENIKKLMNKLNISEYDRKCVKPCLEKSKLINKHVVSIDFNNGIVTGKESNLLTAASAALLNALKELAGIDDSIDFYRKSS